MSSTTTILIIDRYKGIFIPMKMLQTLIEDAMEIAVEPAQDPGPQDVSVQILTSLTGVKGSHIASKLRYKSINNFTQ